ncbi:hypothetical protein O181_023554 [Austropuccinia psidii MF-1]|uniref:tripeptidyl-peptidase II n=1 Tax=Austropuccinia psidii MF-1 TaxID=1389203 RepID=A0A9Q3CEM2_9BASI|nr:hypothetical protein [Austropuccinia psidii MF-1]
MANVVPLDHEHSWIGWTLRAGMPSSTPRNGLCWPQWPHLAEQKSAAHRQDQPVLCSLSRLILKAFTLAYCIHRPILFASFYISIKEGPFFKCFNQKSAMTRPICFWYLLLIFLGLFSLSWSTSPKGKLTHDKRIPNSLWKRKEDFIPLAETSTLRHFKFGLKQSNLNTLYDELIKVSDPVSSSYGSHWTPDRIRDHFAPAAESVEKVSQWLRNHTSNFPRKRQITLSKGRNWVNIQLTLKEAEELLDTRYHMYLHEHTGRTHIACEEYKLPVDLFEHIDLVLPTVHFDTMQFDRHTTPSKINHLPEKSGERHETRGRRVFSAPAISPVAGAGRRLGNPNSGNIPQYSKTFNPAQISKKKNELSHCANMTTLDCLKALYKFGNYQMKSPKNHSLAIVEFTPQSVIYKDMDQFFSVFSPEMKGARPKLFPIDGGVANQDVIDFGLNGESNLDLQYSMPFVYPLNVSLYQVGDPSIGASFNNFLDALDASYCSSPLDPLQDAIYPNPIGYSKRDCGTIKPADIISVSYGMNEADATPAYLSRQCDEYGKLGLMGITFLFSSGDNGVAGNRGVCLSEDGSQSLVGKIFNPSFPGTCPYVTSVGATQVAPGRTVHDPEVACYTRIHSGGGFSNHFQLPKYQSKSLKNYFKNHSPSLDQAQYNSSRRTRGFPDVSANGANYVVAVDGKFGLVYGSSASAPVIASMLSMINDARIMVGRKPVGFINPAIYSSYLKSAFNDITQGANPGCGTQGFSAVQGWDPVTGLGTVDFSKLLPLWEKL